MRQLWLGVAALLFAQPAMAQDAAAPIVAAWRTLAEADTAAALVLIEENHPGAAAALGDRAFQARLATARRHVAERLPRVTGFDGYSALMAGLAADFGDAHIWSQPLAAATRRRWAGLVIVRRGGAWRVASHERAPGEPDLAGAALESCDGVPAEPWARERLGAFAADPGVEAALAKVAPRLLIDDGNPFLPRPKACRFVQADGSAVPLTLAWRGVRQSTLESAVATAMRPAAAGMGIRPFAGGWWIALESLSDRAGAVVTDVQRRQAELRAAPAVVLDLRGNGGGNSAYGDEIARVLLGEPRLAALKARTPRCGGAHWRASPGGRDTLRSYVAGAQARGDAEGAAAWTAALAAVEAALAAGEPLAPKLPACARTAAAADPALPVAGLPAAAMRGRLVLLTDRACFSSCLMTAALFRQAGALHVGEATDRTTNYMEVREITLPSGLRTFSTLQKVAVGLGDFGPYVPTQPYPGAMDDTAGLEAWVAGLSRSGTAAGSRTR